MRKVFFLFLFLFLSFCETSCEKSNSLFPHSGVNQEVDQNLRKSYLVDKIYDGDDNLRAEYFYNSENNLVEIKTVNPNDNTLSSVRFKYKDGKVSNITYSAYSTEQDIIYNTDGKIEKVIYKNMTTNGLKSHEREFFYNKKGELQQYLGMNFTVDKYNNVIRNNYTVKREIGPKHIEKQFEYDNNPRPNFNIDYLFIFEPLPYFGEEALIEKNYSWNNMVKMVNGTTWKYEYNRDGLPIKINTIWSENKVAFSLKIVYKRVK